MIILTIIVVHTNIQSKIMKSAKTKEHSIHIMYNNLLQHTTMYELKGLIVAQFR